MEQPALIWYGFIVLTSIWGGSLYRRFRYTHMDIDQLENWYQQVRLFTYVIFGLWTILFILYSEESKNNLQYVVVLTQVGASVIAATFLFSDKKIFVPILLILMYPLVVYFAMIQEAYGYFLAAYSVVFLGLLLYTSNNSYHLIQQIYHQAQHDPLTGLYNRRYFSGYLEQMLNSLESSTKFAYILLIDLDYFKTINDSLGHEIGDKLLIEVANRIESFCEDTHLIARIGGDEFMMASYEFDNSKACMKEANLFSKKLLIALKDTYIIDNHHLHISASIGIKQIGKKPMKADQVIKEADIAMYEVKAQGRDGIIDFNDVLARKVDNNLEVERRLYFALKSNEIELHYQPQVNQDQKIIGCEVLVRWHNAELGMVSPEEFIMIAEKTGLIIDLGNYILVEAFKTLKSWDEKGIDLEQFSINISVRQFLHSSFIYQVEHLCDLYLNENTRKKLVFEVTETLLAEDISKIASIINELKSLGIAVSMDDFGTGYSSLSFLREIPIDELKIDRAFVSRLGESHSDKMMVSTIISLANIFNLSIVAEGVETGEQFRFLLENGCSIFQGYYFSKPLRREDFEIYLQKQNAIAKHMPLKKTSMNYIQAS
jgi:diguanylate cyclase (GGDEF)-like protein